MMQQDIPIIPAPRLRKQLITAAIVALVLGSTVAFFSVPSRWSTRAIENCRAWCHSMMKH